MVAALLVLLLAAGVMGSFAPGVQAQEPEECDRVWCGSATVKAGAGDADGVGYKPGADYPGSTLDATTFTYKDVSYTIGGIVNDPDDGEVTLLLSPLPAADTVLPLTFRVGDTALPFGEGTRSETDGAYSWTDSTEFGAEASPFVDDASIEFAIAKDALPGPPNAPLALASLGDEMVVFWTAPSHAGARSIEGYRVEFSEDGGETWSVAAENEPSTLFSHNDLLADTTYDYRVSAFNSIGAGEPSAAGSGTTGRGHPPKEPTGLSAVVEDGAITLSWVPPVRKGGGSDCGIPRRRVYGRRGDLDGGRVVGFRYDLHSHGPDRWHSVYLPGGGDKFLRLGRVVGHGDRGNESAGSGSAYKSPGDS